MCKTANQNLEKGIRMNRVIYLDHAATTRPFAAAVEAMLPFYGKYYGNASSGYELGEDSKRAITEARQKIAATMHVLPEQIIFTSGGTEGNNWVLQASARLWQQRGRHIITSKIEHPSIINTCRKLEKEGFDVTYLDVNRFGMVEIPQLLNAIRRETILISVMFGNNEIGTIQPIREIGRIASQRKILFHTDGVQAYGHVPIFPKMLNVDFLTASGHKFNGPKGVGFVYVKNPKGIQPLIAGGGQEMGLRAGTENVPGIVGMGVAAHISCENMERKMQELIRKRDYLVRRIHEEIPQAIFNGHPVRRLPGNVNISIPGVDGGALTAMLDLEGICVSSASACSTGSSKPSHVLTAIGRKEDEALGALRLTLGEENTREELDTAVSAIKRAISYLE